MVKSNTDEGMKDIYFQKWCRKYLEKEETGLLSFDAVHELLNKLEPLEHSAYLDTSVAGKFFLDPSASNDSVSSYILCVVVHDHFDFQMMYHIEKKNHYSIVKRIELLHGNYMCNWKGFDGFGSIGSYYFFDMNSTGSGFCASNRYFYDNKLNLINKNGVPTYMYSYWEEGYLGLNSTMTFNHSTGIIAFNFVLKDGDCPDEKKDCDFEELMIHQKTIGIRYKISNDTLLCLDPDVYHSFIREKGYSAQ